MPHFVVDCSRDILTDSTFTVSTILQEVHTVAEETQLFDKQDIKVRLQPFEEYLVGGGQTNFIHVFANIMEGRTTEQKANLSKQMVSKLTEMFPNVPFIAMNVRDFEKATYVNRRMI
jgi:5-carboxymethyl-2-hydroxymuconate isomerase